MRTHVKTETLSFANSFLLLAVVIAGVLNIDLADRGIVSGQHDHSILYRIELAFNAYRSTFPVLSFCEVTRGNDAAAGRSLPSHFYVTSSGAASLVTQNAGPVNTRPLYSSHHHTGSFNIPHQNSDEDEALILPVGVV